MVYLLATRLGVEPEIRFLGDFASGSLIAHPVAAEDWIRIVALDRRPSGGGPLEAFVGERNRQLDVR